MPKNDKLINFSNKVLFRTGLNFSLILMAACAGNGCSERGAFNVLRNNQIEQCQRQEGRAREDCLKQLDLSYDEYQQAVSEPVNKHNKN